jgi:hypothetical protein
MVSSFPRNVYYSGAAQPHLLRRKQQPMTPQNPT